MMDSLYYCYWALCILLLYFLILLMQKRFRLLLQPSMVHTLIWMFTVLLMIFQLRGIVVTEQISNDKYLLVSKFICFLSLFSVIGFSFAHIITFNQELFHEVTLIERPTIDKLLNKFKWIPYCCGIVGIFLFAFLLITIGDVASFSDYRKMSIVTERVGIAAIVQRISGHINILGFFYLLILGYKHGIDGIELKDFFKCVFLCSLINLSIGGRLWIVTSVLPFFITYLLTRHYSIVPKNIRKSDNAKFFTIIIICISLFSIIGILRTDSKSDANISFVDKFLYLTDGARMTNMVFNQYPSGTYELENGKSTFLSGFIHSPMESRFKESISYDAGLSVTVKSIMPNLYYDFGFKGGVIIWGVVCFFMEYFCIRLKYSRSIIGLLLYGLLAYSFLLAPVFNIFAIYTPYIEWIILIFIFRKFLFRNIMS